MPFDVYLPPAAAPLAEVRFLTDARPDDPLGPDGVLLGPPPAPGTEARLNTDTTGVAAHCLALQQQLAKRGLKAVRQIISQNAKYGVVWRADLVVGSDGDGAAMRLTCWRIPRQADYFVLLQPLQMFDPTQSVPPLAP
jgi:hypothetical protein